MSLILALLLAQITPEQPMPKGTALPPPVATDSAVMAPVTALLAGLAAHDGAAILAVTRPEGSATAVTLQPDGSSSVSRESWAEFVAGIPAHPRGIEERLSDPAIEIDGDVAMLWAPYRLLVDGKLLHCGTDHVDLVRSGGAWKILNLTWSARTTGCDQ
jgi:hypothetical protein